MAFNNFVSTKSSIIALVLRAVQILFAVLILILGAVAVSKYPYSKGYPATAIVSGIFSLLIYVPLLVAPMIGFFSPAILLGLEVFASIWWLVAFACSANMYGASSCLWYSSLWYGYLWYNGGWKTGCQAGKAIIAFGVLGWLLSLVTLGLVLFYSIKPAHQLKLWLATDYFTLGGIFPKLTLAAESTGPLDAEATVGAKSVESVDEVKTTGETTEADPYPEPEATTLPAESSTEATRV